MLRILLVEDNEDDARLIQELLAEAAAGVELSTRDRLRSGLEAAAGGAFDILLLDLSLPDSDGLATLERALAGAPATPVVVLAGLDDRQVAIEAVQKGAQDYLPKSQLSPELLARTALIAVERHRLRAAVEEHETLLRLQATALEAAANAAVIADPTGTILWANRAFTELTGYAPSEVVGENPRMLKSGAHDEAFYADLWGTVLGGEVWRGEVVNRRKDGSLYTEEQTITPVRDPDDGRVTHFVAIKQDVTERKRAENALEASEARFRRLAENAPDVIFRYRFEPERCYEFVSPACHQMLGYAPEEFYADPDFGLKIVHPDDRPLLEERREDPELCGKPLAVRWIAKDGRNVWTEQREVKIRDEAGRVVAVEGVVRDVTETKRLEGQLAQAQQLDAVGQLAGGVAHDFNNLITVIMGNAQMIQAGLGPGDPNREELEEIAAAAERAASLTRQLLAFSRKQSMEPRPVDLNALVANAVKMLRRLISEDVQLVTALEPGLGTVHVDPGQIEQVILNLAVNARDAMPRGGRLVVETATADVDDASAPSHPEMAPGRYARLAVTDTGTGIDPETLSRVFEPFFTTKELGKGTGLGLATVYGIVKQSGGFIWPYSEVGRGTTFEVYLPLVEALPEEAEKRLSADVGGAESRGGETILVAEDDDRVRAVVRSALSRQGYSVLEAATGSAALDVFRQHRGPPIRLLVSDVVMPGLSGPELAGKLRQFSPGLQVLFLSGYTADVIAKHGSLDVLGHFLAKPFTLAELAGKVRQVLGSSGAE